ncbi:hypothetical protein DFH07DRAFT_1066441 [Mycena maculata]|uniref:Uncharacterized protein n=1 Tax=Mycena maculata TaxID=230809 RepID=A0AAD7MRZ9_9AGAR|nr:hypothetical protein DFH07DRAFT_1066441 [Mycena maculata]
MTTVMTPSSVVPHSQRLRLIRSMRKLGDLLTETSMLVGPASPPPPLPSHSRGSSMTWSQLVQSDLATPTAPRSFLSLRLPKSSGERSAATSPLSASFSVSLNSPLTPVVDPQVLQERSIAKVTQTLGENVPPELILPPSARKGRKRSSTVSVPEYTREKRLPIAPAATVVERRHHARGGLRTLKHAASSTSLRGSAPEMDIGPFSYASLVPIPSSQYSSSESLAASTAAPRERTISAAGRKKTGTMYRKEAGWSGEWSGSVQNMEDVVRGLRDLRLK